MTQVNYNPNSTSFNNLIGCLWRAIKRIEILAFVVGCSEFFPEVITLRVIKTHDQFNSKNGFAKLHGHNPKRIVWRFSSQVLSI